MENFQKVLRKAHQLKRSWSDFMGMGSAQKSILRVDSKDLNEKVDTIQNRFLVLEDRVSDIDAAMFSKHTELCALCQLNCEELTRGMAYLRGYVVERVKDSAKKTALKLDQEAAMNETKDTVLKELLRRFDRETTKNEIKDKAFKELLERVETLEAMCLKERHD